MRFLVSTSFSSQAISVASLITPRMTTAANMALAASTQALQEQPQLPPLVFIGDRELMSPCEPYDFSSKDDADDLHPKLEMLKQCQKKYGGIGIAACQVGWRTRIFCMGIAEDDSAAKARYPDAPDFPHQFWINPVITPIPEKGTCWFWEGCLSVPGMHGWVERPSAVRIRGWNGLEQQITEVVLDGLAARVAQHENDHLDGILFPQRSEPGTLLPVAAFEKQNEWADDWPTVGARTTKPGSRSLVK